jgi:hypothetical protein
VTVVHTLDSGALVDIGTRDDKVSVDRLMIVLSEFAQVEHEIVSVMLSTEVIVVHKLDCRAIVEMGTRDVKVSVDNETIVVNEFAQWAQETVSVILSTVVMVVQELDTEVVVGTDTVIVATGTRDDRVSVDRLIIVRNEFLQVEQDTVFVKLSTTVAVTHELDVESSSGDVEHELVSVKVSKMVVKVVSSRTGVVAVLVRVVVNRLLVAPVESVQGIVSTDSHSSVVVVRDSENNVLEISTFTS